MKRLVYFFTWAFSSAAFTQSFHVKNANLDYVTSAIYTKNITITDLADIRQDNNGLHWFQTSTEIFSFDGINKRSYKFRSSYNKEIPFKINGIEVLDDNTVLASTENGMYVFDRLSESFVWVEKKYPSLKGMPPAISCFYKVTKGKILFTSALTQGGFFILDWNKKAFKYYVIDNAIKASIPYGEPVYVTSDNNGNVWGITKENGGIWSYNEAADRVLCSWKNELTNFSDKRFYNLTSLTYSPAENVLWISHGEKRYLEKMYLQTNKSFFYSFSNDLEVHSDSSTKNNYPLYHVKVDRNGNEWIKVSDKYVVKLSKDIHSFEYLTNDKNLFFIGDWSLFKPEDKKEQSNFKNNDIVLWVCGEEKLSMIKKRPAIVRHIPFDATTIAGIDPDGYTNPDNHKSIFFEKGRDEQYFLYQQDEGRPKFICLDKNFKIKKILFNDKWKQYSAFFSQDFDMDTFYIAFMRPGLEALDLRKVIVKEFKVDLNTFNVQDVDLTFGQRVRYYGYADAHNVYWIFSAGYLYSYDPKTNDLDSIYICKPAEKRSYPFELIKGYDYPTVLHKSTSTFWIDFIPTREIYKINLESKKVEKIFNCWLNNPGNNIPGGVFDMYNFDEENIYLQQSFSAMLINAKNDQLTDYSDLFKMDIASQTPNGSGLYGDLACYVLRSHIYFINKNNGIQKKLTLNEDFKWALSQFNSKPLVNDQNEMILMSSQNKGFVVFDLDSISVFEKPGDVQLSFITLDNKLLPVDSLLNVGSLKVKFDKYNSIQIAFSDNSVFAPSQVKYEYTLYKEGDTIWNQIDGQPELTLSQLSAGNYKLLLRSKNMAGDLSNITSLNITVLPPFWQTLWFRGLIIIALGSLFYGLYRYRVHQLKRLQFIRNNIASDLHDDIGSTLNSISIYSEVAKQQAGKDIPALDMIGTNSRKIIENMSDIVWTINPENDSFEKIIVRMRSFAYQLLKARKVEYTFEIDERMNKIVLPMQVRKNFYLVFKEAITNVVKYSRASRVSISLCEKNKIIILRVRDNGKGIPVNAETQGNGLMNMTKRATEIKAELSIVSPEGGGTEIELMLDTIK